MNSISQNKKHYKHIHAVERERIAQLLYEKHSMSAIARMLGRSPSTISREVHRNGNPKTYHEDAADRRARTRWNTSHKKTRIPNAFIQEYIHDRILQGYSPEQIAGRLPVEYPSYKTNYESIYLYIYHDHPEYIPYLKTRRKKRYKRGTSKKKQRNHITSRTPVALRGDIEGEYGHWEFDTVGAPSRATIAVLIEKQTRFTCFHKIPNRKAETIYYAIRFLMRNLPAHMRKSIAYDNGSENALHQQVNKYLGTRSYFCTPYHAWEKGQVEHSIKRFRYYYPKSTHFYHIKYNSIIDVQHTINSIPMKCLNFRTPAEAFSVALSH